MGDLHPPRKRREGEEEERGREEERKRGRAEERKRHRREQERKREEEHRSKRRGEGEEGGERREVQRWISQWQGEKGVVKDTRPLEIVGGQIYLER